MKNQISKSFPVHIDLINTTTIEVAYQSFLNHENNSDYIWDEMWIEAEVEYGYYDETSVGFQVKATRYETDEEYAYRLEKERIQKEKQDASNKKNKAEAKKKKEAKDLEEYQRLREKYKGTKHE